jgi:hypothetical protein
MYLCLLVDLGRFFNFLIHTQSVGLLGREINPPQGRYLHVEQHPHTDIHASSGIPTHDPMFERAKTVHALDRAATVISSKCYSLTQNALKLCFLHCFR